MKRLLALMMTVVLAASVYGSEDMPGSRVVKKLRYPEYDDQGRLRFELMGDEATIRADGLIQIINLMLVFYEDGESVMRVTSPSCLFDREKQTAVSTSTVFVSRAELELTGKGFEWNGKGGGFKINDEARVVIKAGHGEAETEKTP